MEVAPRVRGWTPAPLTWRGRASGCPACAGMDRPGGRGRFGRDGLPRVCGDGPAARKGRHQDGQVAPRVRGWTHAHPGRRVAVRGCPACAGMDPVRPGAGPAQERLPRVCGDGPLVVTRPGVVLRVAPRVRGWTRVHQLRRRADRGCPACAGMDPATDRARRHRPGLPRVCGDGPADWCRPTSRATVAPRVRGWTRAGAHGRRAAPGCPACAGMDPLDAERRVDVLWLPRVCGDGPAGGVVDCRGESVAPRVRGWTPRDAVVHDGRVGCPACAGMDPCRATR